MYQARLFPNAEVKYLNNRQDAFSVPVIYSKKEKPVEGEEEEKISIVVDSLMIKVLFVLFVSYFYHSFCQEMIRVSLLKKLKNLLHHPDLDI